MEALGIGLSIMTDPFTKDIDQITIERRGDPTAKLGELQILQMMKRSYQQAIPKPYRYAFKEVIHRYIARAEAQRLLQGGKHAAR